MDESHRRQCPLRTPASSLALGNTPRFTTTADQQHRRPRTNGEHSCRYQAVDRSADDEILSYEGGAFSHGCRCTLPVGCIQAETGQKIEERETPPFTFRPGSRLVETIGSARISKRRGSSGSCLF